MILLCLVGKDKRDILQRSPYISNSIQERTEYFDLLDGRKASVIEFKGNDKYILRDLAQWERVLILRNGLPADAVALRPPSTSSGHGFEGPQGSQAQDETL